MRECSVCFGEFSESYSLSCEHTFCQRCIFRVLEEKETCPLCRKTIVRMHPSPNPNIEIRGDFSDRHFGVKLTNDSYGVKICDLKRGEIAHMVARVGDYVTHVNGVPVLSHKTGCSLLNESLKQDVIHLNIHTTRRRLFQRLVSERIHVPKRLRALLGDRPVSV